MTLKMHGYKLTFPNLIEFIHIYLDVFIRKDYIFIASTQTPLILDCGAHIGVSVLYFKKIYPKCRIIAFEPDPKNFTYLTKNVRQNNLTGVKLINAAVSSKKGSINFYVTKNQNTLLNKKTWSWGNTAVKNPEISDSTHKLIKVPAVKLSSFITSPVDLVKLDIESLETSILEEIKNKLHLIKNVVLEFHEHEIPKGNSLARITSILKSKNFVVTFKKNGRSLKEQQLTARSSYILICATLQS